MTKLFCQGPRGSGVCHLFHYQRMAGVFENVNNTQKQYGIMQERATLRTRLVFTWYIMHQPKHCLCRDPSIFLRRGGFYTLATEAKNNQEPLTWSKQLPSTHVKAFSRNSLFLKQFWHKFKIQSLKSHKSVSKTYRPKNDNFCILMTLRFPFCYLTLLMRS